MLGCSSSDDGEPVSDVTTVSETSADGDAFGSDASDQTQACEAGHVVLDLGTAITEKEGLSTAVDFELPACVRAFVITLSGDGAYHYILSELTPVGGLSLVPKAWLQISSSPMACVTTCANRILAQPAQASFLFPNTPLVDVAPGPHRLRVFAFKRKDAANGAHIPVATEVKVRVDVVLGPDKGQELHLPLNICTTGASGITAKTAATHSRVIAALASLKTLLAPAKIVAEPVRYFDVPPSHRFINSIQGPQSDLAKLFRSGKGLPVGVNLFLVESIDIHAGGPPGSGLIPGLSGGVPGPPGQTGCDRCGVAVSLAKPPSQADLLGTLMAHEVAHYLGLLHSTEMPDDGGASLHDNLPDTEKDADDNLMFWAVTEKNALLTAQQSVVLRSSPWLQEAAP